MSTHPEGSKTCRPRELLGAWAQQWPEYAYLPLETVGLAMTQAWLAQGRHPQLGIIVREASELAM